VKNKAGYFVSPTAENVAVGLLGARINSDLTSNLSGVYNNLDKRAYPLSSYSYMVVPTATGGTFSTEKGASLSAFVNYFLCEGQQQAKQLGYSPLPKNLVQNGLTQAKRIPGAQVDTIDISKCNNPTFSSDGTNTLAKNAPFPRECDNEAQAPAQCNTPTEGEVSGGGNTGGQDTGGGNTGGQDTGGGVIGNDGVSSGDTGGNFVGDTGTSSGRDQGGGGELFGGGGSASGGGLFGAGTPTAVQGEPGWTNTTTLMLLAVALLLLVAIAPPLVARRMGMSAARGPAVAEPASVPPRFGEPPTGEIPTVRGGS
jgi:hypothetical protein